MHLNSQHYPSHHCPVITKTKCCHQYLSNVRFFKKIGGDYDNVTNLVSAEIKPYNPKPSITDISSLEYAVVFVCNGVSNDSKRNITY